MKKSKNFYLLPYRSLAKRWRTAAILLIPAGGVLWWAITQSLEINPMLAPLGLVISIVGILLTIYTTLMKMTQVRCHANRFVIHTPLYPIAFSYQRVQMIRSVEMSSIFPPEEQKGPTWRRYRTLWGRTVIVVMLKSYPMSKSWLKLWCHPFLLHPKETAVILPVEDWLGLSQQLEGKRVAWKEQKRR